MQQQLKVFNGFLRGRGKSRVKTIVAASTQKAAAELLGISISELRRCWLVSENSAELEVALAHPGKVFQASSMYANDFLPRG